MFIHIFFDQFPLYLLNLDLMDLVSSTSQPALGIPAPLSIGITGRSPHPSGLSVGAGDLNSGSYACTVNISATG